MVSGNFRRSKQWELVRHKSGGRVRSYELKCELENGFERICWISTSKKQEFTNHD